MLAELLAFTATATLIVLLPGPDTLVVVRNLLRGGKRRAALTVLGVLTGLSVWVITASLGLSAVLRASHTGYDVLRIVGAAYLVWIGLQSILSRGSMTGGHGVDGQIVDEAPKRSYGPLLGSGYVSGLLTDLLNPKVGVFFISFLPGFVPHGQDVGRFTLLLGAIFVVLTGLYFAMLLGVADRVVGWMNDVRMRRRLDRAAGLVFIGFGVRLATERA
jgi:threonine/homoserine/homoserine lactone efflux protein